MKICSKKGKLLVKNENFSEKRKFSVRKWKFLVKNENF